MVRDRRPIVGVGIDVLDYGDACDLVLSAARDQRCFAGTALAVHGVVTASKDPRLGHAVAKLDLVTPDGQPVKWALNWLHRSRLTDRVAGPTLTRHLLGRCASEGVPVFLYGSTGDTLAKLKQTLPRRYPGLSLAGTEASKFCTVDDTELEAIAERITASGARLVLVGLGCPRQELFIEAVRTRVRCPLVAIGAAFDFEAETVRRAPAWIQRCGLEWLYRLAQEPVRLWRRYLVTNVLFLLGIANQRLGRPFRQPGEAFRHDRTPA